MSEKLLPNVQFAYKRSSEQEEELRNQLQTRALVFSTVLNGRGRGLFPSEHKQGLQLVIEEQVVEKDSEDPLSMDELSDSRWILRPQYAGHVDTASAVNGVYLAMEGDDLNDPINPNDVYNLFWNWIKDEGVGQQSMRAQLGDFSLGLVDIDRKPGGRVNGEEVDLELVLSVVGAGSKSAAEIIEHARPDYDFADNIKRYMEAYSALRTQVEHEEIQDPAVEADLDRLDRYTIALLQMATTSQYVNDTPLTLGSNGHTITYPGASHRIFCGEGVGAVIDVLRKYRNFVSKKTDIRVIENLTLENQQLKRPDSKRYVKRLIAGRTEMIEMQQ